MSEKEYKQADELDGLGDLEVPPRGESIFLRTLWYRAHEAIYVVQRSTLDNADDMKTLLTAVLVSVMNDAEEDGFDFVGLVESAEASRDTQIRPGEDRE